MNIKQEMLRGAQAMGIEMSGAQAEQFEAYHHLLIEGNARMNLTRISTDDPREAVDRHYLDSIAPLGAGALAQMGALGTKLVCARRIIDVGAGAGLPGVPLSIMLPGAHVVMLDALKKRVDFLSEVIEKLGLDASAEHSRAEDAGQDAHYRARFDVALARAVAALPVLLELCMPMLRVDGLFVGYKGPALDEEIAHSGAALRLLGGAPARSIDAHIPDRPDWQHKLCLVQKMAPTPARYPRRPADIKKQPLG